MRLTDKELEIMDVLWTSETPLTASDIVSVSQNRTWQDISIHNIMKSLLMKNAVVIDHMKPTTAKAARAFRATTTIEEYVAQQILGMNISIRNIQMPELFAILARNHEV